jgi:beta-1,4-mannosyltransferase
MQVLMMPDYRTHNQYQQLLAKELEKQNIIVFFTKSYKRVFPLFREAKQLRINNIHLHWPDQYIKGKKFIIKLFYGIKFLVDLLLCRITKIRVEWVIHNEVSHNSKFPKLEISIYRIASRLVKHLWVHTSDIREQISKSYKISKNKISVRKHPSYKPLFPCPWPKVTKARATLKLPLDMNIYLHFGMISKYKGISDLLDEWTVFSEKNPDYFLLIAGESNEVNYANELIDKISKLKRVRWDKGFVTQDRIPFYFQASDAVVLPYKKITTSGSEVLAKDFNKLVIYSLISL